MNSNEVESLVVLIRYLVNENYRLNENLIVTQQRCTELVEENRLLSQNLELTKV